MNENTKVPEGWKRVRLGEKEFFKIVGSGIEYFQGYKNYLSTNSVQYSQITHIEEIISYRNRPSRANMQPKKDRIAFAKMRNSIKVLLINEELEKEYILSTGFAMIETTINPRYVFQYFLSDRFNRQKDLLAEGTTQEAISNDDFERIFITYPIEFHEQQKIAEILETVDRAIEKTDKIIEKYKRIKQGLMQDLLTKGIDENGKIRSEKTHKFKNSPLGKIPEEWEVVRLGEVVDLRLSNVDKKIFDREKKVLLCNYLEVYQNDYVTKKLNFMVGSANNREIEKFKISKGDVIITKDSEEFNDIAKSAYVRDEIDNLVCGYHLALLKVKDNIEGLFLSRILAFPSINIHFQKQANGITRFGITKETIENAFIPLPPLSEQKRIAEILSQIDNTIEKEEAYKQKLERFKKGLMEDLLTGKVRVNKLIKEKEV
ncbi:MAG: Type I restriction-modification system, specificity subunit S [Ignavibacteriae bacterium]|nr:MAG: Type I restriction-modification system, specificity subunit S [Ignavibacteriota bacterium]